MGREMIGSVTEWEPGADTDWANEMAQSFLAAALGDPPDGVNVRVAWQDHDLGSYPVLCVDYPACGPEPWDFIRQAEDALNEFNDAIDWHRIRASKFWPSTEDDWPHEFDDPADYLDHLADTQCEVLRRSSDEERADGMQFFRRFADQLGIDWISRGEITDEDEVMRVLSPGNMDAKTWAQARCDAGQALAADPDEPDSVISQMSWPIPPGGRARDD